MQNLPWIIILGGGTFLSLVLAGLGQDAAFTAHWGIIAAVLSDVPVLLVLLVRREAAPAAEVTSAVAALTRLGAERLELSGLDPSRIASFDPVALEQFMNDDAIASLAVG